MRTFTPNTTRIMAMRPVIVRVAVAFQAAPIPFGVLDIIDCR